jgi:hypothetical protein
MKTNTERGFLNRLLTILYKTPFLLIDGKLKKHLFDVSVDDILVRTES